MPAPVDDLIAPLERAGVRLAVLFGSRARGDARADSDVDIGVIGPQGEDLLALAAELGRVAGMRVDLIDLRRAGPLLAFAVAREGRPLIDPTGTEFPAFASLAARRYADTAKFRKLERESLLRFARERSGA